MAHSHWLVTQSVTSYINLQGIPLGVFHCLVIQGSAPLCKQYHVLLVAAPTTGVNPGRASAPLLHSTVLHWSQPNHSVEEV